MTDICLGNPYKLKYKWQSLCENLYALLKPSLKTGGKLRVYSTMAKPILSAGDVMVYMIPSQDDSRVARHFGEWDEDIEMGFTHTSEPCASEVYLDGEYEGEQLPPDYVAKLVWHEIAHNKAQLSNKKLHRGSGLRKAFLRRHDSLTDDDIKFMKRVLTRHVRQWTGGFDFG